MKFQNGKVILTLDDGSKIKTSEATVVEFAISTGTEVSDSLRLKLEAANNYQACLNKAYDFLSRRPHGEKELSRKLWRSKKFSKEDIERVMSEMDRRGYLDDEEFCRLFIDDSFRLKPSDGPSKIRQKLMVKGIPRNIIDSVMFEMARDPEDEYEKLKELAQRKWQTYPDSIDFYKKKEKLYRFLAGKGFASAITGRVAREFTNRGEY